MIIIEAADWLRNKIIILGHYFIYYLSQDKANFCYFMYAYPCLPIGFESFY